jgi:ubiquinone/menaquinone biosynthesis C-methylase UbiE
MNSSDFKKNDIKFHVLSLIDAQNSIFKDKKVLDFPAGNGFTSQKLKNIDAEVHAFDVFPDYCKIEGLTCKYSNINENIAAENDFFDHVICQEGIEHFQDQFKAMQEFNRVLKTNGTIFITTPNTSSLRSRLSVFLTESEHFKKISPVNELDSIWKSDSSKNEIYFGHVFLISASKLRLLAKISGFELIKEHKTESNLTSYLLLPLFYPFILLSSFILLQKKLRKNKGNVEKSNLYREIFKLTTSVKTLTQGHLFYEFKKTKSLNEIYSQFNDVHQEFGRT